MLSYLTWRETGEKWMNKVPAQLSASARRIAEYLEIADSAQKKQGFAKRWDFYKKAMAGGYTDTMIAKLEVYGLIREEVANLENKEEEKRYYLTQRGETYLSLIRMHPDVAALLTFFSGDRLP